MNSNTPHTPTFSNNLILYGNGKPIKEEKKIPRIYSHTHRLFQVTMADTKNVAIHFSYVRLVNVNAARRTILC